MFKKILIANRGEIALRVIRACREMGITTVAIFSPDDRKNVHVRFADEAYEIFGDTINKTYLNVSEILKIAKKAGADAIHPGYGFLSENSEFAKACEKAKIKFIGPGSNEIRLMGNKLEARAKMIKAKIPIIPGTKTKKKEEIKKIGYPVMIKAAGGGGGKGIRIVHKEKDLASSLERCISEAKKAFGNPEVYVEKFLAKARHVEVQVLADEFGNTVYLGERECSIQRRHQKLIEETPCAFISDKTRKKLCETGAHVAKTIGYKNAGTVEFLVDDKENFYFLEMNTRLQVEHPVTEFVTGIDIVKEQIKIAAGKKLSFKQADIKPKGASIEARIYAEDPDNNFMPSVGKIKTLNAPSGPFVRLDSGIYSGYDVSIKYDPLLAKLIVWGEGRQQAISKMKSALTEFNASGIKTTVPIVKKIVESKDFKNGNYDIHYLEKNLDKFRDKLMDDELLAVLASVINHEKKGRAVEREQKVSDNLSAWQMTTVVRSSRL